MHIHNTIEKDICAPRKKVLYTQSGLFEKGASEESRIQ